MNQPLALLRKYKCIYLATPYTLHRGGPEMAWAESSKLGGDLIAEGIKVFSPIAHSHSICEHSDLDPLDHDLWLDQDEFFMDVCDALVVATFVGWENSYGISQEVGYFRSNKKPIHYLDPIALELV
jgi:nucleoside 2-deoxyribosyltransferase